MAAKMTPAAEVTAALKWPRRWRTVDGHAGGGSDKHVTPVRFMEAAA